MCSLKSVSILWIFVPIQRLECDTHILSPVIIQHKRSSPYSQNHVYKKCTLPPFHFDSSDYIFGTQCATVSWNSDRGIMENAREWHHSVPRLFIIFSSTRQQYHQSLEMIAYSVHSHADFCVVHWKVAQTMSVSLVAQTLQICQIWPSG